MSAWEILLPAFVFSGLLIAMHTYFGLHVLARGIIFVDLALAQMAALGASIAFLVGYDVHGATAQMFAFGAAVAAGGGFALLRRVPDKTTREVVIGSAYVIATAVSVLILSQSAQGMDELKSLFNGSILWVSWSEIGIVALAYATLALLHMVFWRKFSALSFDDVREKMPSFLWEFAFFATFAMVITLAVNTAGILIVFAFLILPAFSASLMAQRFSSRLWFGWVGGLVASVLGLWLAYMADLPVGATIVTICGALPPLALALRPLFQSR
jgi:zinc/manganese transport system permease protein